MPNYRFDITDASGKWRSGNVSGSSRDEVSADLAARGMIVENLEEVDGESEARSAQATRQEVAEFVEQLAALTRSGLPLPSGLRAAGLELRSFRLRSMFEEMARRVERGQAIEASIDGLGVKFPPHIRGLLLAGARSGRLAEVLGEFVRRSSLGLELRRRIWARLAYPLTALGLVAVLVWFICNLSVTAIGTMVSSLRDFGLGDSRVGVLLSVSKGVVDDGPGFVLIVASLGLVGALTIRMAVRPAARRRLVCSIPVVGPLLRFTAMTEFCHMLAMLLEARLPLPRALDLAGESVSDADLAESCGRMARAVASGEPLSTAIDRWPGIPAGLGQLFRWSETQENLPTSLRLVGDMFEARARSQGEFLSQFLATIVMLLLIWWVGFAVAALYLPMISMIRLLSGLAGILWV